jgi:hypothetical protein
MQSLKLYGDWKFGSIFLVGISLSIGWGIRGNFGHEYGAAFAGSLAAIAVALLSGREDWRGRVAYFAFFGALGWGFGASVSYMQVLSYTESGHTSSQLFGYFATFYIGFLWGAMGGAGTGFAAAAPREKMISIFKPLMFVFGAWILLDLIEDPVAEMLQKGAAFDDTWSRHKNPLYWFDADYLPAFFALLGAGIYDLWNRRGNSNRLLLPVYALLGALAGWVIQLILATAGLDTALAHTLTYLQGDLSYINPETGKYAYEASNLLNNWPQWFGDYPKHIGWVTGLILGSTVYFIKYGRFRNGSSLFVYMGGGWLISFLIFPVFGSVLFSGIGGLRMTPPRSDDWAGITGVFIGTSIWLWRNDLKPVAVASLISGTIGGLGFSGMQWLKQVMMSFGNPRILEARGILPGSGKFIEITSSWERWQAQNWHSFLEQSYGFINGIAIAAAIGYLIARIDIHKDLSDKDKHDRGWWTKVFAALFVMLGLTYFNMVKNIDVWSDQLNPAVWKSVATMADSTSQAKEAFWDLPYIGRLPGIHFLHLSPRWWFNLTWLLLVTGCIIIVLRHRKSPLAIIPDNPLARGQIIYLIILWIMIVANFERALTGWQPGRMLTEWVIFVNAIIATVLIILLPKESIDIRIYPDNDYKKIYRSLWMKTIVVTVVACIFFLVTNRLIYRYPEYSKLNHKSYHTRFGPDASWRTKPNLKNGEHR